jgi:hypothetical protein
MGFSMVASPVDPVKDIQIPPKKQPAKTGSNLHIATFSAVPKTGSNLRNARIGNV